MSSAACLPKRIEILCENLSSGIVVRAPYTHHRHHSTARTALIAFPAPHATVSACSTFFSLSPSRGCIPAHRIHADVRPAATRHFADGLHYIVSAA